MRTVCETGSPSAQIGANGLSRDDVAELKRLPIENAQLAAARHLLTRAMVPWVKAAPE